jgi:glycosyltransferase involved in cell wall biosynthesis
MQGYPIRILHIVGSMNRGGMQAWLMSVMRNIDRERFQMDFLAHTTQHCTYDDEIHELGGNVIPCRHPQRPLRYARRFRRIVQEYGPYDVVHSHVYWFSGYTMWLSAQEKIPRRIVQIYPHEDLRVQSPARRMYRKMMCHWISRHATGTIADSCAALKAFSEHCDCAQHKRAVIYPVVDLALFRRSIERNSVRRSYGLRCDLPIVLYVARFYPHKNHRSILEIARLVNQREELAHFVMAGSHGPLLSELREATRTRADVSILAEVEDVAELMLACDLFVFPSLNEGFGIVALEAQAAGLPVVATNLPSIREVLSPRLRPLMFEPNELNKAASSIEAILSDESLRERVIRDGHNWVKNFSIHTSLEKLVSFYTL